jgi:hypothetical protein
VCPTLDTFKNSITVKKKKTMRDAGEKHKGDGKFQQSQILNGPIYMLMMDFSDRSICG